MKNWEGDYKNGENKYQNRCTNCGSLFFGHKHRNCCKECFVSWEDSFKNISPWKLIGVLSKLPIDCVVLGFDGENLFIKHEGQDYAITALTSENPVWVKKTNDFIKSAATKSFEEWLQLTSETKPRKKRGFQDRLDAAIAE